MLLILLWLLGAAFNFGVFLVWDEKPQHMREVGGLFMSILISVILGPLLSAFLLGIRVAEK